jgi:hypothetical protein
MEIVAGVCAVYYRRSQQKPVAHGFSGYRIRQPRGGANAMADDKDKVSPARREGGITGKKPYRSPQLKVYGNLRQITMQKGGSMMEDPMPKTKL